MRKNPYSDKAPYEVRKAVEGINKEIEEELKEIRPDMYRINKLREEMYMPGLFSDVYGYYDRFRSPW